jgi:hypothetical protein
MRILTVLTALPVLIACVLPARDASPPRPDPGPSWRHDALGDEGTEYRLEKSERIPYRQMNAPGGEAWVAESLR